MTVPKNRPLVLVAMGGHAFIARGERGTHEEHARNSDRIASLLMSLVEREYDHVFAARIVGEPDPCAEEVSAVARWRPGELLRACEANPERFTPWFRLALRELEARGHLSAWSRPVGH